MSRQRRSRRGWRLFPLAGSAAVFGSFVRLPAESRPENVPSSSTEHRPMPYALRNARFTARVSATRISAPRTFTETLDGSASPMAENPLHMRDLYTVAFTVQRDFSLLQ